MLSFILIVYLEQNKMHVLFLLHASLKNIQGKNTELLNVFEYNLCHNWL